MSVSAARDSDLADALVDSLRLGCDLREGQVFCATRPDNLELPRRFTVNRNYLQAIAGFITTTYGRREKLYAGLKAAVDAVPQFHKIQRGQADLEEVRRFLTLAWTSEIQLHLPALMGNPSMLAFANAWAPVHAYYAVFGTLQAWFAANGMKESPTTTPPR